MFQSLLNRINLENRLTVSIVGGFSIAFAIFLTIYIIILPSDKNFDTAKDSSLVDFVRLRKNDFLNERERALPEKPPPPKKPNNATTANNSATTTTTGNHTVVVATTSLGQGRDETLLRTPGVGDLFVEVHRRVAAAVGNRFVDANGHGTSPAQKSSMDSSGCTVTMARFITP